MKILFIRNTGRFSGSETYDINLFKEFWRNKAITISFLTNLPALAKRVAKIGFNAQIISWGEEGVGTKRQLVRAFFRLLVTIPRYLSTIRTLEKGKRFEYMCLQSMTEKLFLTPILKIKGYKIIWTELGPIYATQMSRAVTFLYKIISLYVDKIITISKDTKNDLINGGVERNKIVPVYIGIDTNIFKPPSKSEMSLLRKKFHINPNTTVIGYLGTVTWQKGIEDFLAVSKALLKHSKNFHFIVIGDGELLNSIKASIKREKLSEYYLFTGFVEDVDVYLGVIDVLLLPTHHYEGLSLAILEAQSMGKVVITSNMGGNSEIIRNGKNGVIYKKLNVGTIAKTIENLSNHKSKMVALGAEARQNIVTRFNIRAQAKKFLKDIETYDYRR